MNYSKVISEEPPLTTTYCINCRRELKPPFLKVIGNTEYMEPPDEEWFCYQCSFNDEAWGDYKTLDELLAEVESLFYRESSGLMPLDFSLEKHIKGWRFTVINDWVNWSNMRLEHNFGYYSTAKQAVIAFLNYVKENNVNVSKLRSY